MPPEQYYTIYLKISKKLIFGSKMIFYTVLYRVHLNIIFILLVYL
jgi:hypothetical protein